MLYPAYTWSLGGDVCKAAARCKHSSLGGIGGSAFTPIVNAPEVGILGVSKSAQKPVFIDGEFKPRLMLPLCLSYDHRVIDGAVGAKFIVSLQNNLASMTCDLK